MSFVNLNNRFKLDRKYNKKSEGRSLKRILVILGIFIIALVLPSIFIFLGLKQTTNHGKNIINSYKSQINTSKRTRYAKNATTNAKLIFFHA